MRKLGRRDFLRLSVALASGAVVAACAPAALQVVEVEKEVPVEKVVVQTVEVEKVVTPTAPAPKERVKVTMSVWLSEAELEAMSKLAQTFIDKNPWFELEYVNITGGGPYGREKLQTMIAAGTAPDLMMLNTGQFEGLAARGVLLELDPLIERDNYDMGVYLPQILPGCKYKGKMYAMPKDASNVIVYCSKDMFDAAGIPYPNPEPSPDEWTWNDFLEACKKMTIDKDEDGQVDQWGFELVNNDWNWGCFAWANGGVMLSEDRKECHFTDPETVEGLEFYFDLRTKWAVTPAPGTLPEQAWALPMFTAGSIAMTILGPWARPGIVDAKGPFGWDVAHMPASGNSGQRGTCLYVDHYGIYSDTNHPEASWEYAKWVSGPEGMMMWAAIWGARSICPVKAVCESPVWLLWWVQWPSHSRCLGVRPHTTH